MPAPTNGKAQAASASFPSSRARGSTGSRVKNAIAAAKPPKNPGEYRKVPLGPLIPVTIVQVDDQYEALPRPPGGRWLASEEIPAELEERRVLPRPGTLTVVTVTRQIFTSLIWMVGWMSV